MNDLNDQATEYVDQLSSQLRKGVLTYCVLHLCSSQAMYTSDIINRLREADLVVVEGTIYPLLSRLRRDELLEYHWQESDQGPPRKYYQATDKGRQIAKALGKQIDQLHDKVNQL